SLEPQRERPALPDERVAGQSQGVGADRAVLAAVDLDMGGASEPEAAAAVDSHRHDLGRSGRGLVHVGDAARLELAEEQGDAGQAPPWEAGPGLVGERDLTTEVGKPRSR